MPTEHIINKLSLHENIAWFICFIWKLTSGIFYVFLLSRAASYFSLYICWYLFAASERRVGIKVILNRYTVYLFSLQTVLSKNIAEYYITC